MSKKGYATKHSLFTKCRIHSPYLVVITLMQCVAKTIIFSYNTSFINSIDKESDLKNNV